MTYRIKTPEGVIELAPGKKFVTITSGMSGHFAVIIWLNNEDPDNVFPEPYNTGYGRYATKEEAYEEAKMLSKSEAYPLEMM